MTTIVQPRVRRVQPSQDDPYVLTPEAVEMPPVSLTAALRRIGPGMVLAASIVGSGELIATTTLGAAGRRHVWRRRACSI